MILVDYNGVAISTIFAAQVDIQEDLIRHMILNSLRMYNKKFREKYGQMVICCDAGGNWRREFFPEYKQSRRDDREEDKDGKWDEIFRIMNMVRDELVENFPFKVIHVWGCEADDIIGTLAEDTQEFGRHEDVMIISVDKDFVQLQKYDNVSQFNPRTKKLMKEPNPRAWLFEHICKGDGSDGIPNVLMPDDFYLTEGRASPMTTKKINAWAAAEDLEQAMGPEIYRNFQRNQRMIDLEFTPQGLKDEIINKYDEYEVPSKKKVLPFLIKKRCRNLIDSVGDFL